MRRTLLAAACLAASVATADARIVRFEVTADEPAFNGASFGQVGAYRRIAGRAFGEVDPAHPGNAIIQDISLAPRNARGLVEYWTDVEILVPAERARECPRETRRVSAAWWRLLRPYLDPAFAAGPLPPPP